MVRYDRDEIRRESNDYLDRRQDRLDGEAASAARSASVYRAIIDGNQDRARWLLDVPPAGGDIPSTYVDDESAEAEPPTAQAQLREHVLEFETAVKRSDHIRPYVAQRWIDQVRSIELTDYFGGHTIVDLVEDELGDLRIDTRPPRDIFSMSVTNEMQHMNSFDRIEGELRWMRALLDHVYRLSEEQQ